MSQSTTFERELDDAKTQVRSLHRSYQSVDGKVDSLTQEVGQLRPDMATTAQIQELKNGVQELKDGVQDLKNDVRDIKNVIDSAMVKLLEKIDDGNVAASNVYHTNPGSVSPRSHSADNWEITGSQPVRNRFQILFMVILTENLRFIVEFFSRGRFRVFSLVKTISAPYLHTSVHASVNN
jgi:X-X-X-Leu-X-X-Gly heptad repeat protein